MKKALPLLLLLLVMAASSCKHTSGAQKSGEGSANVEGAQGTSFADAIVIKEKTETSGVAAEYAWLKKNYPGYKLIKQSLVYHEGKPYDKMDIKTAEGKNMSIYFDISNFFGKF